MRNKKKLKIKDKKRNIMAHQNLQQIVVAMTDTGLISRFEASLLLTSQQITSAGTSFGADDQEKYGRYTICTELQRNSGYLNSVAKAYLHKALAMDSLTLSDNAVGNETSVTDTEIDAAVNGIIYDWIFNNKFYIQADR